MKEHVSIKTVREGIYLLWRLGWRDEARKYAFSSQKEKGVINNKINSIIDETLQKKTGGVNIVDNSNRFLNIYKNRFIDEAQLSWVHHDKYGQIYLWLWLLSNHLSIKSLKTVLSNRINLERNKRIGKFDFTQSTLAISNPTNASQCFKAALYALDLFPFSLEIKHEIIDRIRKEYFEVQSRIRKDFSWLSNVEPQDIEWVQEQFRKERKMSQDLVYVELEPQAYALAIPLIYYLWDCERSDKKLYLNTLRKRFANVKHRKKVADKAPINIRVAPETKKILEKLEKKFNRNRADVIEYLIKKSWQELNSRN